MILCLDWVYKDSNLKPKMKDIVIHNCLEFLTTQQNQGVSAD